jgi:rhodanese-related sulfurtransferase
MSILFVWLAIKVPQLVDFIQSLPPGFFIVFLSCFVLAHFLGKGIGSFVNRYVVPSKNKKTSPGLIAPSNKRKQTSKANNTQSEASISTSMTINEPSEPRKKGVASPEELQAFVDKAGDRLVVIDTRNPDAAVEPDDQTSLAVAGLPSSKYRSRSKHLLWDLTLQSMPLPEDDTNKPLPKDTPIITHCGAGGRGQMAKEFLEKHGFTNVVNGGGPKESECWAVFGDK